MSSFVSTARGAVAIAVACTALVAARPAHSQTWFNPSFQPPRVTERDYTGAVAANAGTAALFQWREGLSPQSQLGLEAGLLDGDGDVGTKLLVGGSYARELARSTTTQPLDVLFTAGAGFAVGDGPDLFRIPVGVSLGHRFLLEGGLAVTPYVHPRISFDFWGGRGEGADDTELSIDFDLGASLELTPQLAVRASVVFGGSDAVDDAGFGLGLTFTPAGLRR